jgi:hypothetical protein
MWVQRYGFVALCQIKYVKPITSIGNGGKNDFESATIALKFGRST